MAKASKRSGKLKTGEFLWLENGIFPCNIGFTTCREAYAEKIKQIAKHPEEFDFGDNAARVTIIRDTNKGYYRTFVVTLRDRSLSKAVTAALIAHEATHVAQFLWEEIGESEPGSEAEAYLVQAITQQILEFLWKEVD